MQDNMNEINQNQDVMTLEILFTKGKYSSYGIILSDFIK